MTHGKKGQAALETAFVALFIVVSIALILSDVQSYYSDISTMSNARMKAQGAAMNLTMGGTATYLVRIDLRPGKTAYPYVVTEDDCGHIKDNFAKALGYPTATFDWECNDTLAYKY